MIQTQAKYLLKKHFGYENFRRGQSEIISKILDRTDVLAVMPTGAGKSICYQIPALMFDGVTIVISPLISLMKDQVDTLCEMGINAVFINSSLSMAEFGRVIFNARHREYKLIYVAPERLETDSFLELIQSIDISMVAVDEAHCVSQWGHDFRPSYRNIAKMLEILPQRPVVAAFTATATPQVKEDISRLLKLTTPFSVTTGFDRENLYFEVLKPADKFGSLTKYLTEAKRKSGIIYAATRKTVDSIHQKLDRLGYSVTKYHAGLSEQERVENQEAFICDRYQLMVATNAFGMGIDKSNIAFVIHYNMPKNMESYYQEAGRAGRDGENAECILFYSPADIITNKFFIENSNEEVDKSAEYQKLNDIVDYCNTDKCLRAYILAYFGEKAGEVHCDKCGNCNSDIESTDVTIEAQKIMSCIKRMGERFGSVAVTDVLRGANTDRIRSMGFNTISTYGIMKDYSKDTIKELISFLTAEGYIELYGDQYPVLRLGKEAFEVLRGNKKVAIRRAIIKQKQAAVTGKAIEESGLFEILRTVRKRLADEQKVPPFVVFSDATLRDMCRKYPASSEEMLSVSGVGSFKLEKYGEYFISAIREYITENKLEICSLSMKNDSTAIKTGKTKSDTRLETYALYKNGLDIGQIARERGLAVSTIESHLLDCLQRGMQVEFENLYPDISIPQVIEAIKNTENSSLREIKEKLPAEVTYGIIKFVLYKYNISQSSEYKY
jgi:ATP-dependent DNA helicase RecQ